MEAAWAFPNPYMTEACRPENLYVLYHSSMDPLPQFGRY